MGLYQCRGYVRSISSDETSLFVGIRATTQFDCKKNMLKTTPTGSFDSTVYNIFIEVELPKKKKATARPIHLLNKVNPKAFALPEDYQILAEKHFESFIDSFGDDFETESTFIIEDTSPVCKLSYVQIGPESSDE